MVRSVRPLVERSQEGIAKLGCSLPSADACEHAMAALDRLGSFEVAHVGQTELETTTRGANKGAGALWPMGHLVISPTCAVAFGDSENATSLAGTCRALVAVSNAEGCILQIADDICGSVHDDGVAHWLQHAMAEADGNRGA